MGLPNVSITISKGGLGKVNPTADAVAGMVCSGVATTGYPTLGIPVQLFSLDDLVALGFTAANNVLVYNDVKDFYAQAGAGAELWLMVVADTALLATICDNTSVTAATSVKTLLNAANGRIRILSINRKYPVAYTPVYTVGSGGIDDDAYAAVSNLQAVGAAYATAFKPFRAVICGQGYRTTTPGTMDLTTGSNNKVAVMIGSVNSTAGYAACGLVLGRMAGISVQRSIGRVLDGNIGYATAYFVDGVATNTMETSWNTIYAKGYIFLRNFYGKSGFFFTDDTTATAVSDDYSSLARGRVIDKALTIAYTTMVNNVNDDIEVDPTTGYLSSGMIASWKAEVENAIRMNMIGQISGEPSCYINPAQNFLSTNTIVVSISIIPKGYAKTISVNLGLVNPFKTS